jgi:hypothetical protein
MTPSNATRLKRGSIVLVLFVIAGSFDYFLSRSKAAASQRDIEEEMKAILPPEYARRIGFNSSWKTHNGAVVERFLAPVNREVIKQHYERTLEKQDWVLVQEDQRLFRDRFTFCRNNRSVVMVLPLDDKSSTTEYSITIAWGKLYAC